LLATGNGVPKDDVAARAIYEKAAARGDAGAQWSLGVFYHEGRGGLTANPHEAFKLWKLAAEQGHPLAQVKLGIAYIKGEGTRTNAIEAYAWLAASEVDEAQVLVKDLEKKLPAPLLAKARKLADERRALRDPKKPQAG